MTQRIQRSPATPDRSARVTPPAASVSRILLSAGVGVAVIVLAVMHRRTVDAGGDTLVTADREWLVLAVLATVAMWIAGTVSLLGAVPIRPPLGRTFAVQIAATFVNHLLPAGIGSILVNLRFLQRSGLPRNTAVGALGLNSLATSLTHLALLAVVSTAAPATFGSVRHHVPTGGEPITRPLHEPIVLSAVAVLVILTLLAVTLTRPRRWLAARAARWRSKLTRVAGELKQLRAVLAHPGRAAALWLSSLTLPLFHTLILYSVLHSLGARIPLATVTVIYLSVSALATFVPSPGGIGGLDLALAAALAATGVPTTMAVGAVLGYRMITVWLPLLPAASMLTLLLRRRII